MDSASLQIEPHALPTRDRILAAARRLFYEQGYHATGIATILREADANSGSLYHHFASKEALLSAVLQNYVDLLRPVVMGPVEQATPDPIERVFALLAAYRIGVAMGDAWQGCPIGNLALELGSSLPEARELIDLNFRNWHSVVRSWLEAAGDRLPGSATLDRAKLAVFILTVMEGGVMQARAAGDPGPYDDSVAVLRRLFDVLLAQAAAERKAATRELSASGGGGKEPTS